MLKRSLGRTDLDVSVLCFGGNVFGWTTDRAVGGRARRSSRPAAAMVSADVYSLGAGQQRRRVRGDPRAVDEGPRQRREIVVATKLGSPMGEGSRASRAYMVQAVEDVAKRLGATLAQVALAWIANRPGMTGLIASATTPGPIGGDRQRHRAEARRRGLVETLDRATPDADPLRPRRGASVGTVRQARQAPDAAAGVRRGLVYPHGLAGGLAGYAHRHRRHLPRDQRSRRSRRTCRCSSAAGSTVARR